MATHADVPAVVGAVREMLFELGGTPPGAVDLKDAALAILDDGEAGALFVAETEDELVGVLGVSWQTAIRVPGPYGLIQELWVTPTWRKQAIGRDLLAALFELALQRRVTRIEVGLPSERFPSLPATEAFYRANGFSEIGMRMRRVLV
jgi:GNAT superfamily N-acetyltransferase